MFYNIFILNRIIKYFIRIIRIWRRKKFISIRFRSMYGNNWTFITKSIILILKYFWNNKFIFVKWFYVFHMSVFSLLIFNLFVIFKSLNLLFYYFIFIYLFFIHFHLFIFITICSLNIFVLILKFLNHFLVNSLIFIVLRLLWDLRDILNFIIFINFWNTS